MKNGRGSRFLASVAAACIAAPGCSSAGPDNCGLAAGSGGYRFCGGDQQCVCTTNRCARSDPGCAGSGWRYAYGSGECVVAGQVDSRIPSDSSDDLCPAADADADADADGDVPDADGDGGDGEGDGGGPLLIPVMDVGRGQDPRAVPWGPGILIGYIGDQTLGVGDAGRDTIYFRGGSWDLFSPTTELGEIDVAGDGVDANLGLAWAWASCTNTPISSSAVFWHSLDTGADHLLVRATWDGSGTSFVDRTADLVDVGGGQMMSFQVASDGLSCFAAWLVDPDGAGPDTPEIWARRLAEEGVGEWGPRRVLKAGPTWTFHEALDAAGLPLMIGAVADGQAGLVVAVPARNADATRVVLLAQRVNSVGGLAWNGGSEEGLVVLEPDDSRLIGFEAPNARSLAASATSVHFAVVGVTASDRCLYFTSASLPAGSGLRSPAPSRPCAYARTPMLAMGASGQIFMASAEWSGGFSLPADVYLARADNAAIPELVVVRDVGVFPKLAVGVGSAALVSWIGASSLDSMQGFLTRATPALAVAPGWPAVGLPITDVIGVAGNTPEYMPPLPAPDGGAVVAWTEFDADLAGLMVRARRVVDVP